MPTRPRGGNRQNMQQGESVGTSSRTGVTCFGVLLLQAISVGAWQHPPCHVPAMRGNAGASARGASRFLCPSLKSLTMLAGGADEQKTLRPVVLCPAQFGTAEDYDQLKVHYFTLFFRLFLCLWIVTWTSLCDLKALNTHLLKASIHGNWQGGLQHNHDSNRYLIDH